MALVAGAAPVLADQDLRAALVGEHELLGRRLAIRLGFGGRDRALLASRLAPAVLAAPRAAPRALLRRTSPLAVGRGRAVPVTVVLAEVAIRQVDDRPVRRPDG